MANNIYKIYDQYSSEDYLCNRTKPRDIIEYVCFHCGHDIDEKDIGHNVCFWCGCDEMVVEKT